MHVTSAVQHLRRHCHSDVFSCRKSAPSAKCQAAVLAKVRSDLKAATCAFERHQAKKASNASNVINLFAKCVRAIELPLQEEGADQPQEPRRTAHLVRPASALRASLSFGATKVRASSAFWLISSAKAYAFSMPPLWRTRSPAR